MPAIIHGSEGCSEKLADLDNNTFVQACHGRRPLMIKDSRGSDRMDSEDGPVEAPFSLSMLSMARTHRIQLPTVASNKNILFWEKIFTYQSK